MMQVKKGDRIVFDGVTYIAQNDGEMAIRPAGYIAPPDFPELEWSNQPIMLGHYWQSTGPDGGIVREFTEPTTSPEVPGRLLSEPSRKPRTP